MPQVTSLHLCAPTYVWEEPVVSYRSSPENKWLKLENSKELPIILEKCIKEYTSNEKKNWKMISNM
jgi:hypothetical protein